VQLDARYRKPVRSSASHEVSSPSAHTGRVALFTDVPLVLALDERSGLPASRTIPLRRSTPPDPRNSFATSRCTLVLAVLRCCGIDAASPDQADRGVSRSIASWPHRRPDDRWGSSSRRLRSVARVRSGKPVHTLASDPAWSSATTSVPSSKPWSCTDASFSAAYRYPMLGSSRPGRANGPSHAVPALNRHRDRPTALLGFYPSQVYSRRRVSRHLCQPGPTCRSR